MGHGEERCRPAGNATKHPENGSANNAHQDGPVEPFAHQHERQGKSEAGCLYFPVGETAEADKCRGVRNDEFGVSQSNKRDEHPDSCCRRMLQAIRHSVDNLLPNARDGENQKQNAGKANDGESSTPGNVHGKTDGIGEIGVQRHSRREGNRIIRVQAHDNRGDRGGKTRGENNAFGRHSGFGKNLRVDHDNVSHGHKSSEASKHLLPNGGLVLSEFEIAIDQSSASAWHASAKLSVTALSSRQHNPELSATNRRAAA